MARPRATILRPTVADACVRVSFNLSPELADAIRELRARARAHGLTFPVDEIVDGALRRAVVQARAELAAGGAEDAPS